MSTTAIDTARTNERLSVFLAEIGANEPVDNFFPKIPALKLFLANKQTIDGGRQILYPIDSGFNTTIKDFSDYDVFDTSSQDTALTVVYPFVNKGGTITVSWEEIRETKGSDHAIFDLVKFRRANAMKTLMDQLDTDLFAATQAVNKISALPTSILATGALGGLSQATDSDWASTVTASGSFAAQGLTDMRNLWNTLADNGAEPNWLITTPSVYQFYEAQIDPDVRYSMVQTKGDSGKVVGGRGFGGGLEFNGTPIVRDKKANSGVLYMGNDENIFMIVDSEGNFAVDEFQTPVNQKVSTAKIVFRGNLVINRRKSLGKLTGVVA